MAPEKNARSSPRGWFIRWGWMFVLLGAVSVGFFQIRREDVREQGLPVSKMPLAIQINAMSQRAGMLVDGKFESVPINPDNLSLSALLLKENDYKHLPILPEDTPFPRSIHQWFQDPDPRIPLAVPIAGQVRGIHVRNAYKLTIRALADAATSHFNQTFPKTLLTVPHRLDEDHRGLVSAAAKAAGLEPLRVIHEATAAAIGHGLDRNDEGEVFMLAVSVDGGGLASVELLVCEDGVFDKLASVDRIRYTTLENLLPRLRSAAQQVLDDARIEQSAVQQHFLPIGASPDLAPAQEALASMLKLKNRHKHPSPADAVIVGAATQAKAFVEDDDWGCGPIDILPLSLGFETSSGVVSTVIRRFTVIPTRKEQYILPAVKGQTTLRLRITLGERALAADNHFVEEVEFDMMLPALDSNPDRPSDVVVEFEVDPYMNLVVVVKDERYGEVLRKPVSLDGLFQKLPLDNMIFAAEHFAEQDDVLRRLAGDRPRVGGKVGSYFWA